MSKEIERKFLLRNNNWRCGSAGDKIHGTELRQGYLSRSAGCTVRVRQAGRRAFLTVKGPTSGFSRSEYEYEIPLDDCRELLDNLAEKPIIEKTRYLVEHQGLIWEVDEFHGENAGLLLAELELESEEQEFSRPDWLGEEVTGDPRYINANLVRNPYSKWRAGAKPPAFQAEK